MWRLAILLVFSTLLTAVAFASDAPTMMINGEEMMSLSTFGDTFGAAIGYDSTQNGFYITLGNNTVEMVPYGMTAWVNGNPVSLTTPAVVIDDIAYVPLYFLCNVFGLNCDWNASPQVISSPFTPTPVVLVPDLNWGRCPHVWIISLRLPQHPLFPRGDLSE